MVPSVSLITGFDCTFVSNESSQGEIASSQPLMTALICTSKQLIYFIWGFSLNEVDSGNVWDGLKSKDAFLIGMIRISDPRSLRSQKIKGADKSKLGNADSSFNLMYLNPSVLRPLIVIWIIPKTRTLRHKTLI